MQNHFLKRNDQYGVKRQKGKLGSNIDIGHGFRSGTSPLYRSLFSGHLAAIGIVQRENFAISANTPLLFSPRPVVADVLRITMEIVIRVWA